MSGLLDHVLELDRAIAAARAELKAAELRLGVLAASARAVREALGGDALATPAPPAPVVPISEAAAVSTPAPAPVIAPTPAPAARAPRGSAVANVLELDAAGVLERGVRDNDGRLTITQYGGPTDRTPDANTRAGIGNRDNQLRSTSLALSRNLIDELELKGGEEIHLEAGGRVTFLGHYDDTTGSRANLNVVDVYDPKDELGRDNFMRIVPAGEWSLEVRPGGPQPRATAAAAPAPAAGRAAGLEIGAAAIALVGKPFPYQPETQGGVLGCADVVSQALIDARVIKPAERSLAVMGLSALLEARYRWTRVSGPYRAGDVLVWGPNPGGRHGHIGVVVGPDDVVHNSSSLRQVVRARLSTYDRPLLYVLRAPGA